MYVATRPDRASNGAFLSENIDDLAFLTGGELLAGAWSSPRRVDPGTYWLMIRADADFAACYRTELGGFDPACADGYSEPYPLTVPRPVVRWSTGATVYRFLEQVDLRLRASRYGERVRYRLCWRTAAGRQRCRLEVLTGFSWDSEATDTVSVSTRGLPRVARFSWSVRGRVVATRRVRVR